MKSIFTLCRLALLLMIALPGLAQPKTIYVKADAATGGDGTTWANAYQSLQDALSVAVSGDQIWVGAGTYTPGTDRTASFVMKDNVAMYGGFPGTGMPTLTDRNWQTNATILSGDIGTPGVSSDNSYHVINNTGNALTHTAILNGFIIEGGYASGSSFPSSSGGGAFNDASSPAYINCVFRNNHAPGFGGTGGGLYQRDSSPLLLNCIFIGNSAANSGGGVRSSSVFNPSCFLTAINCNFINNSANAGGAVNAGSDSQKSVSNILTNCILWGNSGGQIAFNRFPVEITYSIVQGGYAGAGNLTADPHFFHAAGGDLSLQPWSCAIDAGKNDAVPADLTTDLAGHARRYNNGTVDIGAYEYQGTKQELPSPSATTTNNSLHFDGVNDYVMIDNNCNSQLFGFADAITVEYWFKGSNLQSAVRFQDSNGYLVAGWGSSNPRHILSHDGGTGNGLAVGVAATDGAWHHVAFTWQRNTENGFKSYLDGQLVEQRTSSDTPIPAIQSLVLGSYAGSGEFMQGALDDVRVWKVARSQAEILAGMQGTVAASADLLLHYEFDHGVAGGDNRNNNSIYLRNSANPGSFTGVLNNFALDGSTSNWVASFDVCTVPEVTAVTVPQEPVAITSAVSLTIGYAETNIASATIDWGDGTTPQRVYEPSAAQSHLYAQPGVYSVAVTITNTCGETSTSFSPAQYIVVYDPSAGFVTGAGWINSPVVDEITCSTCTFMRNGGKATFGFESKYQKGKTLPSGNTQFKFQAGGMDFRSTDYEWLVIAGSKAQYKGKGIVNGESGYGFMLTAVDGDLNKTKGPDLFRIKIWQLSTDQTLYDNQHGADINDNPATALGGGSVVIHIPAGRNAREGFELELAPNAEDIQILAYPNPVVEQLTLTVSNLSSTAQVMLYDAQGRQQGRWAMQPENGSAHLLINLATLPEGIYLLQVATAGRLLHRQKVLKQR